MDDSNYGMPGEGTYRHSPEEDAQPVERALAQYSFVREERDREVRLLFRDVPANHLARALQASGAAFITLSGERAGPVAEPVKPTVGTAETDEYSEEFSPRKRRKSAAQLADDGEVTMRYFYSLRDLVYTVSIASGSGVFESVAETFPAAALCEREVGDRIAVVFTRSGI